MCIDGGARFISCTRLLVLVTSCWSAAARCGLGGWRNGLLFDPFKKYGDWSYLDIMLSPLVEALRGAMTSTTKVPIDLF